MAAEPHAASAHTPGEMEITEQTSTYHVFDALVRWGSLAVAGLVLFLTLMFCTAVGFIGAVIPTLILLVVGGFVVRKAPTSLETH